MDDSPITTLSHDTTVTTPINYVTMVIVTSAVTATAIVAMKTTVTVTDIITFDSAGHTAEVGCHGGIVRVTGLHK